MKNQTEMLLKIQLVKYKNQIESSARDFTKQRINVRAEEADEILHLNMHGKARRAPSPHLRSLDTLKRPKGRTLRSARQLRQKPKEKRVCSAESQ